MSKSPVMKKKQNVEDDLIEEEEYLIPEETDEKYSIHYIYWPEVHEALENSESSLILCTLEQNVDEHIIACLLYWNRVTGNNWKCVQVLKHEMVSEAKRCLMLQIQNEENKFDVRYFIANEVGDSFCVEHYKLSRKSVARLQKLDIAGDIAENETKN